MEDFNTELAFNRLKSGEPDERAEAIKILGAAAYAPAVPLLAELVEDSDPGTRYLAAMALSKIGDEAEGAVTSLLIALRADDMFLRVATISALIAIGVPAVPGLIRALFDENAAVRRSSAKALGKIGCKDAINPLKVAVNDSDAGAKRLAEEALARLQSLA